MAHAISLEVEALRKLGWWRFDPERKLEKPQCTIRPRAEPKNVWL
jgi:hypothetical protein